MLFSIYELIIAAFFIIGFNAITRKDKLLGVVNLVVEHEGKNTFVLANVISECPTCMSSFYGLAGYLYVTGQIPVYKYPIELISTVLILTTLIEFLGNRVILGGQDEVSKMAIYGAQKISLSSYGFLVGFILFDNGYFDGLIFIVALAGLCNILEYFIISSKANASLVTTVENQNQTIVNCTLEILENKK